MKPIPRIDRQFFINRAKGIILYKDLKANCIVTDTKEINKIFERAAKGYEVVLTVNGKDFSKMVKLRNNGNENLDSEV